MIDMTRLKSQVKRSLYVSTVRLMRGTGITGRRGLTEQPDTLRVLMYHKINDVSGNSITVSVKAFEEQQAYLKRHFSVITLDDLLAYLDGKQRLPPKAVLLTFDDGYRDNLLNAYPILKAHGHRALIFIATDFVGGGVFTHDRRLPFENPTLTWDEIKAMTDVFDIGSHGISHRILTTLPFAEAKAEIVESKRILEAALGREVPSFSYPKGSISDFNDDLERAVGEAGYKVCFTTLPRTNVGVQNRLRICRYNVEDYGLPYFSGLLDGSADPLGFKDTKLGYEIKRLFNRATGTHDQ